MGERQIWKISVIVFLSLSSLSVISGYAWSDRLDLSRGDDTDDYFEDMHGQDPGHPNPGDADILMKEGPNQITNPSTTLKEIGMNLNRPSSIIGDDLSLQEMDEFGSP